MSAHILNIIIEKINKTRRVRFHHMIAELSRVLRTHECAHASVSGNLNTGWTLCEQQRELRSKCNETEKGLAGGGICG
jgi:hypothetical protein